MAQNVRVSDAWAKYGLVPHDERYALLQRVSHWTEADVQRERELRLRPRVEPSFILTDSFVQLLDLFEFGPICE